jgi:hypothetical protein
MKHHSTPLNGRSWKRPVRLPTTLPVLRMSLSGGNLVLTALDDNYVGEYSRAYLAGYGAPSEHGPPLIVTLEESFSN